MNKLSYLIATLLILLGNATIVAAQGYCDVYPQPYECMPESPYAMMAVIETVDRYYGQDFTANEVLWSTEANYLTLSLYGEFSNHE